ncbi:unnamed protein product [Meganyctiphanes norvegica]|uniref:Uncharacterized protein n=1 Tax=Meganyctiphanes norvegica TaxID=48144 RepID=A0AAV2RNS1_MEGNR
MTLRSCLPLIMFYKVYVCIVICLVVFGLVYGNECDKIYENERYTGCYVYKIESKDGCQHSLKTYDGQGNFLFYIKHLVDGELSISLGKSNKEITGKLFNININDTDVWYKIKISTVKSVKTSSNITHVFNTYFLEINDQPNETYPNETGIVAQIHVRTAQSLWSSPCDPRQYHAPSQTASESLPTTQPFSPTQSDKDYLPTTLPLSSTKSNKDYLLTNKPVSPPQPDKDFQPTTLLVSLPKSDKDYLPTIQSVSPPQPDKESLLTVLSVSPSQPDKEHFISLQPVMLSLLDTESLPTTQPLSSPQSNNIFLPTIQPDSPPKPHKNIFTNNSTRLTISISN